MKWREVMISDVCSTYSGGTPPTQMKELYYGGKIPWVKSGELNDDIIISSNETLTDEGFKNSSAKWAPPGSILVAMYGATVGKTAMLGIPATTNQAVCCIVPNGLIADNKYIWYAIRSKVSYLLAQRVGGAQPNINQAIIRHTSIPFPPLSEQRRIAHILDQSDSLQKDRVEANEKMQRVLPTLFYKMFGDPLLNNRGFEVCSIGSVLSTLRNGTTLEQNSERVGCPVTRIETISDGTININRVGWIDLNSKERTKWRLNPGDILFSHINSELHIGKTALYEGDPPCLIHGMNLLLMRPNPARVIPKYLHALLNSESVRYAFRNSCKRAVNQASLNQKDITSLRVSIAPKNMQLKFSRAVDCYQNSRQLQNINQDQIKRLFDTLLHRAFSGELTANWREANMKELLKEMDMQARELDFPDPDEEVRPIRVTDFPNPLLEKKAILLSYIIFCSLDAKHQITRVKLAKQYYFVNQFMKQPLTEHFKPMAAHSLDNDSFVALEFAQDRKWVVIEPQKGKEKPLSAGARIAEISNLVVDILGSEKEQVDEFLGMTKDWGWESLERWATIHSVAMKMIEGEHPLTVESIKSQIQTIPEWEAKLKRCEFSDANINNALIGLKHWGLLTELQENI